jgi:hypothetical protein
MYRPPMPDEITRRAFIGTTAVVVFGHGVDAQRTKGRPGSRGAEDCWRSPTALCPLCNR